MATYVLIKYNGELPRGFDAEDLRDFIVSESAGSIGRFHPDDPAFSLIRKAFSGRVIHKKNSKYITKGGELREDKLLEDFKNLMETVLCDSRYHHPTGGAEHSGSRGPSGQTKTKQTVEETGSKPRTLHPAGSGTLAKAKPTDLSDED